MAAVRGGDFQGKVITGSVGRNIDIHADDILGTEQMCQILEYGEQLLRPRRVVKLGVRFSRNHFQEAAVNRPSQANRVYRYAVDGSGLDAFVPIADADIAVFAAVAQYHDRAARKRRAVGDLDAQVSGVVERGLSAICQAVDGPKKQIPVRCVIHHQRDRCTEGYDGHRVIRPQGVDILSGRLFSLSQGTISHAATGINHQNTGKSQIVVCDVLHTRHIGQTRQIATDREVVDIQARDELAAGVENAGVDGDI